MNTENWQENFEILTDITHWQEYVVSVILMSVHNIKVTLSVIKPLNKKQNTHTRVIVVQ